MADWKYGMVSKSSRGGRSMMKMRGDDQEFEEEDVWSLVRDREAADSSSHKLKIKAKAKGKAKDGSSAWHHHSGSKMIPSASAAASTTRLQQSSAPVSIPDWSKIYGKNGSRNGSNWVDHDGDGYSYGYDHKHGLDDDRDYGDDNMVPPHEWVARKLAGTQISSFSMCEGIGRTLKGRDLSKVRNAILTKTGFLE